MLTLKHKEYLIQLLENMYYWEHERKDKINGSLSLDYDFMSGFPESANLMLSACFFFSAIAGWTK